MDLKKIVLRAHLALELWLFLSHIPFTVVLWFGWYGFNPGSALMIANPASAATASLCAVTTTMGGAAGCISAVFTDSILEARKTGEWSYDLTMALNGALAGLVAVTAGCAVVPAWGAILTGVVAGWCYIFCSKALIMLRIDDGECFLRRSNAV
jgi:Amt family ammonium transporter